MNKKYLEELDKGYSPLNVIEEASRCLLCYDAPCSKMCPAGTSPDRFIRSVRFRNFKGAAEIIRENNALGGICARVCPTEKYCQKGCSRCDIDRPIEIGKIQRYITDFENQSKMNILKSGPRNNKKVAIIGSGPSSLQASVTLNQLGYDVTIYEKENVIGGMLRLIPEYRLPNKVIDEEINRIKKLGINMLTNVNIGVDISLDELKNQYDGILIATGYCFGKSLPMFENNKNVILAVDLLRKIKAKKGNIKLPDNILVIGGGDVAMDVVTSLKLLGVNQVSDVVYERFNEFKASETELRNAQKLGVSIIDGYKPIKIRGKTVTFIHRKIDSIIKIKADKIVLAVGQYGDLINLGIELKDNEVYEGKPYITKDEKIYVMGDIAKSNYDKTVVGAIRTGKEAALLMDKNIRKENE